MYILHLCRCRQRVVYLSSEERSAAFLADLPTSIQWRGHNTVYASSLRADLDESGGFIRTGPDGSEALLLLKVEEPIVGYVLVRRTPGGKLSTSYG